MRILVVGAGGIGGYFGARLVEKGEDVTFLVRPNRYNLLKENGLRLKSIHGDYSFSPQLITADSKTASTFDIVLVSTKSYHLKQAINDVKSFVSEGTMVLPLLNGMAHMDRLVSEFPGQVLGGLCFIETAVSSEGDIVQTSAMHKLVFGEMDGSKSERINKVIHCFEGTKAPIIYSDKVMEDMWNKYLFITVLSGVTTLFRSPIGAIRESSGGLDFIRTLFKEVESVMLAGGAQLSEGIIEKHMATVEAQASGMKSSMLRDIENGQETEGAHLQGELVRLAEKKGINVPYLHAIYQNLSVYELLKNER
ncbi:ketopantoate reductase family protein [Cytobacillus horneckiae]|uniref:ketopantoate reductase family protein n=1 Tax=Cytobacillus horneckiae TaxID=549687 RepID=UPI003D204AEE